MLGALCMPALIYAIYATTIVVIDLYRGLYNTAFVETLIGIMFTLLLNMLCKRGLTVLSWVVVSIPFILMTVVAAILIFSFGLNPATGKALYSVAEAPASNTAATTMVPQPLPPNRPPATQASSESLPPTQPSAYSMPLTVRVEAFRPVMSNRA